MTGTRRDYDAWHERLPVDLELDTPWHRLLRAHLDLERDVRDRIVLEIGCGRGGLALWLRSHSQPSRLVAADVSHVAVRRGAAVSTDRSIASIHWEVGDIQRIAHPDSTFDTVISCETIEHVPDPRGAVRELARVLKPGGRLFLSTPNYLGTMGLFRAYRRIVGRPYTEEGQPINRFTLLPRTLVWVHRAGLSVQRVDASGHYLPLPGAPPRRLQWPETGRWMTRWCALHSFVVARKAL